jgi:hypothetical protein
MRNSDLRTPELLRAVRIRTWALEVDIDELDEITFDTAENYGIGAAELVSDDRDACQRLAEELRRGGVVGAIVPSAALPGTRNTVLFGARVAAPYLTRRVSSIDIPASITAEDGRPPTSLIDRVRFIGERHAGLAAWQNSAVFDFGEPDWALLGGAGS